LASNSTVFKINMEWLLLVSSLEIYPTNLKKIVLADAYGNTIDSVEYFDADPWPTSADGVAPTLT
jgi:hypothetical protein